MSNRKLAALIITVILLAEPTFAAQQKGNSLPCTAEYENHNQIDYGPLIVQEVKGTITDPQQFAMAKVCVAVFTEREHKLVVTTETDADGKFSLRGLPAGRYRLIAKADALCTANVPLRVMKRQKRKQELQVHMKPRGLDTCSYGEAVHTGKSAKSKTMTRPVAGTMQ